MLTTSTLTIVLAIILGAVFIYFIRIEMKKNELLEKLFHHRKNLEHQHLQELGDFEIGTVFEKEIKRDHLDEAYLVAMSGHAFNFQEFDQLREYNVSFINELGEVIKESFPENLFNQLSLGDKFLIQKKIY